MTPQRYFSYSALFAVVSLCMLAVTLIGSVFVIWFEKPFLEYTNLPFAVERTELHPGEVIPLSIGRCNRTLTPKVVTSTRWLENLGVDQGVLPMDVVVSSVEPGCHVATFLNHRVPDATKPGKYRIRGIASVPGLIKNFSVQWYSAPFTVISKSPPLPVGLTGGTTKGKSP